MKIAYIFDTYPVLTETFLAREVAALRREFDIEIWALNVPNGALALPIPAPPALVGGLEKHFLDPEKNYYWRQAGKNLARALVGRGIEHIHAAWANHPAQIAQSAAEKLGVPWSFAAHARDLWVEGGRLDLKLQSAEFAVCCTHAATEALRQHARAVDAVGKVSYAAHGLNLADFAFKWPVFRPEVRILGVGRMVEKKGWLDLLKCERALADWEPPVTLELIGDGPLCESLACRNAAMDGFQLEIRGARPHHEVIEAMKRADCLVVPSKLAADGDRDGLPNVILEAAALGLPVVATRVGAIEEFVTEETGWPCVANDTEALAATIGAVFRDEGETRRRAFNALGEIRAHFQVDENVQTLAGLFRKSNGKDDPLK